MNNRLDSLNALLDNLMQTEKQRQQISEMLAELDRRYDLPSKIEREPGVAEIVKQMAGRLIQSYPGLGEIAGQRVLDIACGSSTSKAPPLLIVHSPFGKEKTEIKGVEGYTAQFEPWFCRILLALGAQPVGIDMGDLTREAFEHYAADLGAVGSLDFLPDQSFDAVQDSRLFGSPEFTAQFPDRAERVALAGVIRRQEMRLLKPAGKVIHSDAEALIHHG